MLFKLLFFIALLLPAPSLAQVVDDDRTYIEFTNPFRLPGITLPAGTYVLAPGPVIGGQLVVDVFSGDMSKLLASCLAVETSIERPEGSTMLDYKDTKPAVVRAWFRTGESPGLAFVYAPDEGAEIFATTGESVPSAVFDGSRTSLVGLLPIEHVDALYRGGARPPIPGGLPSPQRALTGVDRLALARLAILAHISELPSDAVTRLRLLDRQVADLMASYKQNRPDLRRRLGLTTATMRNTIDSFDNEPRVAHIIEGVREQLRAFERVLR
ncbi:MAG: hypothetical protein M3R55_11845 [Acidobacteriota bacterium]|nr:hypothetical protein [Acidobacteriota bacterium]